MPHVIILDRDGVINEDRAEPVRGPAEWQAIAGSLDAIALLTRANWRVVVATNQSGVGRGLLSIEMLNEVHASMCQQVSACGGHIDAVFFCPHRTEEGCACRKPAPGMLHQIATRMRVALAGVPVVGDSERDLAAARAVGARPVLVRTGKGSATARALPRASGVEVHDDLAAFVRALLDGGP